jgi:hypothetical protein
VAAASDTIGPWELTLWDLCMFVGDEKISVLKPRIVYQVVERTAEVSPTYSSVRYRYRVAFDPENPTGTSADTTISFSGTRNMKKLTLLDLGILRLSLDTFIREYAKHLGAELHNVDDIVKTKSSL